MPVNKDLPPMTMDGDELVIGRGANAIRVKGANLKVLDASTHVRGHYPDMYPWDTPHRHPEWDVRRSHACDLHWPPDNIPVAAIPAAIRELKRIAVGGWVVNAPTSEDLLEGAVVRWDANQEMWVAALAGESEAPVEPEKPGCDCGCQTPILPDTDLPQAPNKPVTPVKLPCTDFDARLDEAPTQAISPEFMGIVIGPNAVQTHGVVRHSSFAYPARTPLYLSDTEPGRVTTKDTGVFVGTVLVPGALLLNVEAHVLDKYLVLVKEELKTKIECAMQQLVAVAKKLGEAIKDGDDLNAAALKSLEDFITVRLQQLQSFLDNVNRQYEKLLVDLGKANDKLDALETSLSEAESDGGKGHVVNTIAGRDALVNSPEGTVVFVRDASDDPAVETGPATYILVGQGADGYWANITSSISLEGDDLLSGIDVTALQNAIAKAHGHDNKALLDTITSFGESGVKIGDAVVVNDDGTTDIGKWVTVIDELPEDISTIVEDLPIGALVIVVDGDSARIYRVVAQNGQKTLAKVAVGGGTWGTYVSGTVPADPSALIADLPVGSYVTDDKQLPARSVPAPYNTEEWITESGDWTAPVSGWYEILAIDGGCGGAYNTSYNRIFGGPSGAYKKALAYFTAGQSVPIVIGAGGAGVIGTGPDPIQVGGVTTVGDIDFSKYSNGDPRNATFSTAFPEIVVTVHPNDTSGVWASGPGFGGSFYGFGAARWYGAGGGASYYSNTPTISDGYQGGVRLRYYDPNKENN